MRMDKPEKPYPKPPWLETKWNPATVLSEQVEKWRALIPVIESERRAVFDERLAAYHQMEQAAKFLAGYGSDLYYQIKKHGAVRSYDSAQRMFEDQVLRPIERAKETLEKEARVKEKDNEKQKITEEAILWLQERGLTLGTDFTLSNALDEANRISAEDMIATRVSELKESGKLIEFCGDDYCEDCGGWDGDSRRCSCGNRRVCWSTDLCTFKEPYIYGEAY